jgi:hypothetical protein
MNARVVAPCPACGGIVEVVDPQIGRRGRLPGLRRGVAGDGTRPTHTRLRPRHRRGRHVPRRRASRGVKSETAASDPLRGVRAGRDRPRRVPLHDGRRRRHAARHRAPARDHRGERVGAVARCARAARSRASRRHTRRAHRLRRADRLHGGVVQRTSIPTRSVPTRPAPCRCPASRSTASTRSTSGRAGRSSTTSSAPSTSAAGTPRRRVAAAISFDELMRIVTGARREAKTWVATAPPLTESLAPGLMPAFEEFLRGLVDTRLLRQIGSIGGGNHFVEVQLGEDGAVYVMAHFGSRGLGAVGAHMHSSTASARRARRTPAARGPATTCCSSRRAPAWAGSTSPSSKPCSSTPPSTTSRCSAPPPTCSAATSAWTARRSSGTSRTTSSSSEASKYWQRKGATPAYDNQGIPLLIPGSMASASYVLAPGRNAERYGASVPHGAGRVLARGEAKRTLDQQAMNEAFDRRGVMGNFRHVPLDESTAAYKDVDEVIAAVEVSGVARVVQAAASGTGAEGGVTNARGSRLTCRRAGRAPSRGAAEPVAGTKPRRRLMATHRLVLLVVHHADLLVPAVARECDALHLQQRRDAAPAVRRQDAGQVGCPGAAHRRLPRGSTGPT